jgi:CBS domain-containing protein
MMEIQVKDVMSKPTKLNHVKKGETIEKAAQMMVGCPGGVIPVFGSDDNYLGVIIIEDLLILGVSPEAVSRLEVYGQKALKLAMGTSSKIIDDHIIRHDYQLDPDQSADQAITMMVRGGVRTIPVISEIDGKNNVIGIVTQKDILKKIVIKKLKNK